MRTSKLSVLFLAFWVLCGFSIQDNTVAVIGDSIMKIFPDNDSEKGLGWIILEDLPAYAQPAQVQADFLGIGGAMLGNDNTTATKLWARDNCSEYRVGYGCIESWEPEGLIVAIGTNDVSWFFEYHCDVNELVDEYALWIDRLLSVENGNPDLKIIFVFAHPGHSGYSLAGTEGFASFGPVENPIETPCGECVDESLDVYHCFGVHNLNYQVWKEAMKPMLDQRNIPFIDVFDKVLDLYGNTSEDVADFARGFLDDGVHIKNDTDAEIYYTVFLQEDLHTFYSSVLHDITSPEIVSIVAGLGPDGGNIPFQNYLFFSQDNQTITWWAFDPGAAPGPNDDYGVAHSYFSYRKMEAGTVWSSEIELILSGEQAGYLGSEKWVRPVMLLPEDGPYYIDLIAEDEAGNRIEKVRSIVIDTVPPIVNSVTANAGTGGSYVFLEDNMTFTGASQNIIWISRDVNYLEDTLGWASRLGIKHSYITYRETGQTEWEPEVETVWFGGAVGYWGRWSWITPVNALPADGQYEIKLISEDAGSHRAEVIYQISVDTSGG